MTAYYGIIPYPIMTSKQITNDEKVLFAYITANLNKLGFCDKTDKHFEHVFKKDESTIRRWLKNLESKNFITRIYDRHSKKRNIYIKTYFPQYLDEQIVPNLYSIAQQKFADAFPDRRIDVDVPANIDMDLLIEKIKSKKFLREATNMSLKSCLNNYQAIISETGYLQSDDGKRKMHFNNERNYTVEEMNNLFQDVNDIEV